MRTECEGLKYAPYATECAFAIHKGAFHFAVPGSSQRIEEMKRAAGRKSRADKIHEIREDIAPEQVG